MEQLLQSETIAACEEKRIPFWKNPATWLQEQNLSRGFWIFFAAAFFFDCGFSVYFFLFNLYLLDFHFNERVIGLIGGAMTLGSVAGTLPAGLLARRIGLRPLLIICFIFAPILGVLRTLAMGEEIQISLAFLAGLAMCLWGVCYLPAVAGLTTEKNRASGFGLIFSASIGTSSLGGVLCGYFPQWLRNVGFAMQAVEAKRLILLVSCAIAALGLFPVLRMQLTMPQAVTSIVTTTQAPRTRPPWKASSFLLRFLPSMALWTAVLASFTPFANVYLSRELHVPLSRIGLVFSAAQILQLCVVLLSPMLFRKFGLVKGIVATQILTSIALACLAATQNGEIAMAMFLSFSALQWMCTPGLYNLLMSSVPDVERSTASSMTMFCNAVMQSVATVIAGSLFVRFGYPHVLAGIAVLAVVAAALFLSVVGPVQRHASIQP